MPAVGMTALMRVRAMAALVVFGCPYAASGLAHERALHTVRPDLVLEAGHRDCHNLHGIGVSP